MRMLKFVEQNHTILNNSFVPDIFIYCVEFVKTVSSPMYFLAETDVIYEACNVCFNVICVRKRNSY